LTVEQLPPAKRTPVLVALAFIVGDAHRIGTNVGAIQARGETEYAQRRAFPLLADIASHLESIACAAERGR
jgi:hypothetical protein